jgi:hypothetical protein
MFWMFWMPWPGHSAMMRDLVINATGRIGELIEVVVEAVNSAALLERAAAQATVEQATLGRLIAPSGPSGKPPAEQLDRGDGSRPPRGPGALGRPFHP